MVVEYRPEKINNKQQRECDKRFVYHPLKKPSPMGLIYRSLDIFDRLRFIVFHYNRLIIKQISIFVNLGLPKGSSLLCRYWSIVVRFVGD